MEKSRWPFGKADVPTSIASGAGTVQILTKEGNSGIDNQYVIEKLSLTGNITLNAGPLDAELKAGAILELWITCDGNIRTVTLGTGFNNATVLSGVASKTVKILFSFDGTSFSQLAPQIQIN
jgi:hypothetical protein